MHSWVMCSAIVTGGQGFIGRHLVKTLREHGVDAITLGRRRSADPRHVVLDEASWHTPALDRVLAQAAPDCIFHLAGQTLGTLSELTRAQLGLTRCLLGAIQRTGLRPLLIIAGSAAEYGAAIVDGEPVRESAVCVPLSAYGASKHAQTREVLAYGEATGTPVLVARIFNPLGPDMPSHLAFGDFARQIASMPEKHGTLRVGNIDVRRDMSDVEDTAMLLYRLTANRSARGVVNVCSGEAPLLRDLVEMLIGSCGRKIDIEIDWARVRGNEPRTIVGSTELLEKLGCPPPRNDFLAVIARICRAMVAPRAAAS